MAYSEWKNVASEPVFAQRTDLYETGTFSYAVPSDVNTIMIVCSHSKKETYPTYTTTAGTIKNISQQYQKTPPGYCNSVAVDIIEDCAGATITANLTLGTYVYANFNVYSM